MGLMEKLEGVDCDRTMRHAPSHKVCKAEGEGKCCGEKGGRAWAGGCQ